MIEQPCRHGSDPCGALGEQVVVLGNDELTDGMAVRVEQRAPQGSEP